MFFVFADKERDISFTHRLFYFFAIFLVPPIAFSYYLYQREKAIALKPIANTDSVELTELP